MTGQPHDPFLSGTDPDPIGQPDAAEKAAAARDASVHESLAGFDADTLLDELLRRAPAHSHAAAEPDPEWFGRWHLPVSPAERPARLRKEDVYAVLDALRARDILATAGLLECVSPDLSRPGFVIVAAKQAVVFYRGASSHQRRHAQTAALSMLEAYEAVLKQHGLCVVPRLTGELPQLHLCCFTPRYGLSFTDPDVQLAANLALFDGPSAPERDQELALTAMWAILSDLEWPGACYSFVSDRARLTTKPASQTPAPRIGPRTLGLLLGLATMCQTGSVPDRFLPEDVSYRGTILRDARPWSATRHSLTRRRARRSQVRTLSTP